ncbi:MAG: efflux RND transporter periplasmic adaptor subunit [Myxococcales bacterium]|nr:efflux RND transporter periplasmic adaptor subunit [Myxococcota bacterium]MDW8283203.1 efflux RND transporter periplasmic adaptor subunit [Myxococcales bacterium]
MSFPRVAQLVQAALCLCVGLALGWYLARRSSVAVPRPPSDPTCNEMRRVSLSPAALKHNPIETAVVTRVKLARDVEVVGSVSYNANHHAEVGPLIAGRIVSLRVGIGDRVKAGQVLAELESAEVGQAQAAYLTARATSMAAQANLRRERELAERKVSSERERELAEAQAATEQANLLAATQRLRALGLRLEDIRELERNGGRPGRVPLVSPIDGTVLTREVTLGQAVQPATDAFKVADLAHLWVLLDLFEKDLPYVHRDQKVVLRTEVYPGRTFPARVAYVGQEVDERTRTTPVRIEFENEEGLFRPGQFVTATLLGDESRAVREVLAVPRRAVLTVEGKPLVFVAESDGTFSRRSVELGISGGGLVEIRAGLVEGERVASDGGFLLKSELLR